jgi:hypothetical protein
LTRIRLFPGIVLVAAVLVTAGSAWGQGQPGAGTGSGRTPHIPPPRQVNQDEPMTVVSSMQYRLETLEEDLRLLPEQRSAWLAYRERVLKMAEDAQRTARTALGGEMAAPKRLDQLADIARDRLTAIEDIGDAGKHLYAMLTPAQKLVADRRMAAPLMALAGVEPAAAGARGGSPTKNP